jgi:hypothetical protein
MIYREGADMGRLIASAAVLGLLVLCSILISGCTGDHVPPQPPASTLTIPTTRPVTPVPLTTPPVQTTTIFIPPTAEVTPVWTPGSIAQEGTAILIRGDVLGYKSTTSGYIDEIRFTVVKAPRVDPVTLDIPETQIVFTKGGTQFAANYLVISGDENADRILGDGEAFLVSVPLQPPNVIYTNQKFTMAVKTPPYPQVVVTAISPPVLTADPMVLAQGSS